MYRTIMGPFLTAEIVPTPEPSGCPPSFRGLSESRFASFCAIADPEERRGYETSAGDHVLKDHVDRGICPPHLSALWSVTTG
jgi:hypothetical protein